MTAGGNVLDFHSCDFFPERWFDLVVILRTGLCQMALRVPSPFPLLSFPMTSSSVTHAGTRLTEVLAADNDVLFPRLERRGYSEKKIAENVDCEIMCVVAEEARESYKEDIIWELQSNTIAELDANVQRELRPATSRGPVLKNTLLKLLWLTMRLSKLLSPYMTFPSRAKGICGPGCRALTWAYGVQASPHNWGNGRVSSHLYSGPSQALGSFVLSVHSSAEPVLLIQSRLKGGGGGGGEKFNQ